MKQEYYAELNRRELRKSITVKYSLPWTGVTSVLRPMICLDSVVEFMSLSKTISLLSIIDAYTENDGLGKTVVLFSGDFIFTQGV